MRDKWLERLYAALEDDDPPYIKSLGDHWGTLCATLALASHWADTLLRGLQAVAKVRGTGQFAWFRGTVACYSALYAAGRHQEVLDLLAQEPRPIWPCLVFGARVHAARGTVDEAIGWLQERAGATVPAYALASVAEELLLAAGRRTEAYARFGIAANPANTHLATYRALARKYPELPAERLLADLIAPTPGEEGKWFATAKTLRRFDLAIALAQRSPCDPKTLIRAARDHIDGEPHFALEAAIAALRWMARAAATNSPDWTYLPPTGMRTRLANDSAFRTMLRGGWKWCWPERERERTGCGRSCPWPGVEPRRCHSE